MPDSNPLSRITARQDVFGGKPIIRDMRISAELVLSLLSQGVTPDELLDDYPELEPEDLRACIAYAHAVISGGTLAEISRQRFVKFLTDNCVGRRLVESLRRAGHDVLEPILRCRRSYEDARPMARQGGQRAPPRASPTATFRRPAVGVGHRPAGL